jgi:clan AA aspartic protease
MGIVHAEITLKNAVDAGNCRRGSIKEQDVRQATVRAMVDTGAGTLVINEKLRLQLGLEVQGTRQATFANDAKEMVKIVEPVEVHWKNRKMTCEPLVVGGEGKILLGAIPLEDMDLMVDPVRLELTGAHGDEVVSILM